MDCIIPSSKKWACAWFREQFRDILVLVSNFRYFITTLELISRSSCHLGPDLGENYAEEFLRARCAGPR
jgi:hypothetical protein